MKVPQKIAELQEKQSKIMSELRAAKEKVVEVEKALKAVLDEISDEILKMK